MVLATFFGPSRVLSTKKKFGVHISSGVMLRIFYKSAAELCRIGPVQVLFRSWSEFAVQISRVISDLGGRKLVQNFGNFLLFHVSDTYFFSLSEKSGPKPSRI